MDLNQVGIVLNLIGGVLLYFNGLPSKLEENQSLIINSETIEERFKRKWNNVWIKAKAELGIGLIVIGSFTQLLFSFRYFL